MSRCFTGWQPVHVLSSEDNMSCSRTQYNDSGKARTRDLSSEVEHSSTESLRKPVMMRGFDLILILIAQHSRLAYTK